MRFLPRVYTLVTTQRRGRREALAARLADIRLHPRMQPHVRGKDTGRLGRFPARLTDMPPVTPLPPSLAPLLRDLERILHLFGGWGLGFRVSGFGLRVSGFRG